MKTMKKTTVMMLAIIMTVSMSINVSAATVSRSLSNLNIWFNTYDQVGFSNVAACGFSGYPSTSRLTSITVSGRISCSAGPILYRSINIYDQNFNLLGYANIQGSTYFSVTIYLPLGTPTNNTFYIELECARMQTGTIGACTLSGVRVVFNYT